MKPEEKARVKIDQMFEEAGWQVVDRDFYSPTITAAAIREGRVIVGMSKEEVEMAMGEAFKKTYGSDGGEMWMYARSNDVILDVWFDEKGYVTQAKARRSGDEPSKTKNSKHKRNAKNDNDGMRIAGGDMTSGTPLEQMASGE